MPTYRLVLASAIVNTNGCDAPVLGGGASSIIDAINLVDAKEFACEFPAAVIGNSFDLLCNATALSLQLEPSGDGTGGTIGPIPTGFHALDGLLRIFAQYTPAIFDYTFIYDNAPVKGPLPLDGTNYFYVLATEELSRLFTSTFGATISCNTNDGGLSAVAINFLEITGIYEILTYVFEITPNEFVQPEYTEITVTGEDLDPDEPVTAVGPDDEVVIITDFIQKTADGFIFVFPPGHPYGQWLLYNGDIPLGEITTFGELFHSMTGDLSLSGAANITFISDPSGIYTLVPNKRNDTIYERLEGIDHWDVMIPNPFIKTGYLP